METLEDLGREKGLDGREVFLCTNNMVSDSIATAGSSRLETIYDLVVQIHCFLIRYMCQIRFIHVAGTRMIDQGTDGLSRSTFCTRGL